LLIADGAAIGSEMNELYQMMRRAPNVKCYLPESFEWLILKSGLVKEAELPNLLEQPEQYIESREYFSWEQFFTAKLIEYTKNTYLKRK
jgi:hypothetical protein